MHHYFDALPRDFVIITSVVFPYMSVMLLPSLMYQAAGRMPRCLEIYDILTSFLEIVGTRYKLFPLYAEFLFVKNLSNSHCEHCNEWSDKKWEKVSAY